MNCEICGFKTAERHHIIKKVDFGSDTIENLIYLCPNHHWLADFGTPEDRTEILNLIERVSGKRGELLDKEKMDLIDKKIFIIIEQTFRDIDGIFKDNFRKTSNYYQYKEWFLGRNCPVEFSRKLHEKADKLLLIKKLKESIT